MQFSVDFLFIFVVFGFERFFFEVLLGCTWDPEKLPIDGVATTESPGLLSLILAFFGVQEPQMRGSLHLHLLLHDNHQATRDRCLHQRQLLVGCALCWPQAPLRRALFPVCQLGRHCQTIALGRSGRSQAPPVIPRRH